jgi:hypothetical protein
MDNDSSLPPDRVKTPFMVSFDFAQDKLAHHERGVYYKLSTYPFALSTVEGLRLSFHTVCRSE